MSSHDNTEDTSVTGIIESKAKEKFGSDNVADAKEIGTAILDVASQTRSLTGGQYKDQLKGVVAGKIGDVIGDTKIEVDRDLTSGVPIDFPNPSDPIGDPLGLGKDYFDYTGEEIALVQKYEEMLADEAAVLDQMTFCNNLFEKFEDEIKGLIKELSALFDSIVDKLPDKNTNPFAALYQDLKWVYDYIQLKLAMVFDFLGLDIDLSALKDFFKNLDLDLGEFDFGDFDLGALKDIFGDFNMDFEGDLKTLAKFGYDTYAFIQLAEQMKNKWGDEDALIDEILDDPKGFINGLEGDLEALCRALPSWEKAKTGKLKVTVKDFKLPEAKIDLKEIIPEGVSPKIITIWEKFKELKYDVKKVHEEYISNEKADGKHSNTDA